MKFIAIDLGTSFIKGAVLDLEQLSIQQIQRIPFPEPIANLPTLHFEVDPQELVQGVRKFVASFLPHAAPCAGLVLCSQMHGYVLVDEQGQPLSNIVTWRDERAAASHPTAGISVFEEMVAQLTQEEWHQLGNGLRPGLPIDSLYWRKLHQRLPQEEATVASLPDFVLQQLCDLRTVPTIEPTNAAAHGAFNVETQDWHWTVLQKLGLNNIGWPQIQQSGTQIGVATVEGQSIPCFAAIGDHQCALLGALLQAGELSLNVATGSQVSLVTSALHYGNHETRPFFDGQILNTFVKIPAGRALAALVQLLTEVPRRQGVDIGDPWATIVQAATEVPTTDLAVDLAFYTSADGGSQGRIANIREENLTVGHLFRAAFQAMAADFHHFACQLSPEQAWERIVFSGGLVQRIEPLRAMILAKFGCDHRMSASSEDTLLGLLALALFASGKATSLTHATQILLNRPRDNSDLE